MIYRLRMTDHSAGASPAQRRHLVTEIPGPASRELMARRERAVARGVYEADALSFPGSPPSWKSQFSR